MKSFFPWRLFWKFFFTLLILVNIVFLTAMGIESYIFDFRIDDSAPIVFFLLFFTLSTLASLAFAYRFASPLRRVILKALRMANKKRVDGMDEMEEILQEEPGEYFELEVALDKIRRKMKRRRAQLALERAESQALMLSLDDAILSVGIDSKVKFFNAKFANLFFSRDQSDALARGEALPLAQVLREPEILRLFETGFALGAHQSVNMRLHSKIDGMTRDYQIKLSPLRDQKSQIVYAVMALFHDVTDLMSCVLR